MADLGPHGDHVGATIFFSEKKSTSLDPMTLSHIFVYKTRLLYCLHIEVTWSGANTITVNQVIQSTITSYQWSKQYTQGERQCQIYLQPHLCQKFFLLSKNFCHFCGKKISKTIENDFPTFTKLPNAPIVNFFNKIILNAWFPRSLTQLLNDDSHNS